MAIKHQKATWNIQIATGIEMEISIRGGDSERERQSPETVVLSGRILADVGRRIQRIRDRYQAPPPATKP